MFAKFQLSRLIFVFISCQQLLRLFTADDSCHEKKLNGISIYSLNVMSAPNLSCEGCLGARLESVTDARQTSNRQTDAHRQVKIVLTPALLG